MICKSDEDERRPVIIRGPRFRERGSSGDSPTTALPQYIPHDNVERERLSSLEKEYREMKDQIVELRQKSASQQSTQRENEQLAKSGDTYFIAPARGLYRQKDAATTPIQMQNKNTDQRQIYNQNQNQNRNENRTEDENQNHHQNVPNSSSRSILSSAESSRTYGSGHSQRQVQYRILLLRMCIFEQAYFRYYV